MEVILDTNALSAYADGVPAAIAAVNSASSIALPVVAIGEYRYGIAHSRHHQDYAKWLQRLLTLCRVLEITEQTTLWYAQARSELRRAGKPIPSNDVWIVALARQHSLSILSRDAHFDHVAGLRRLSW
jgi:tRNA(fMet)-specific endonuclease VapC